MPSLVSHQLSIIKYVVLKKIFFSLFWPSHLDLDLDLDLDSNLFGLGLDSDSNLFGLGLDSDSNLFGLGLVLDSTKVDLTTTLPRPKHFTLWLDSRFPHRQTTSGESRPVHLQLHHPEHSVLSPLLYSLYTHDCVSSHRSTSIVKFADDTVVLGLINNDDEAAYLDEVEDSHHGARTTVSLWTWAKLKSKLSTSGRDSSGPTPLLWSVGPLWRG